MKPINLRPITTISLIAACALISIGFVWANSDRFKSVDPVKPQTITLDQWANGITRAKNNNVDILLGDRAGAGDSSSDSQLATAFLSLALKTYPKSKVFTVYWSYTVAMGTDEFQLIYNRERRTLTRKSGGRGKPVVAKTKPSQNVTDATIDSAASAFIKSWK